MQEIREEEKDGEAGGMKRGIIPFAGAFVLLMLTGFIFFTSVPGDRKKAENDWVAGVNGIKIGEEEFMEALMEHAGPVVLDKLIKEELIRQEAKKQGIVVTEQEVDGYLRKMSEEFVSEDAFREAMSRDGFTERSLRREIENQLYIRKLLEPRVVLDEHAVTAEYELHKEHDVTKSKEELMAEMREALLMEQIVSMSDAWFGELLSRAQIVISEKYRFLTENLSEGGEKRG